MLALPELVRAEPAHSWDCWGRGEGAGPGGQRPPERPGAACPSCADRDGPVVSAADDRRSSVGGARAERGTERDRLHGDFCLPMTRTTQDGECGRGKVQL